MVYLNTVRLQQARLYLQNTDRTVYAIAERCGFDSVSYFISRFRREYGVTPEKYRSRKDDAAKG